MKKTLLSGAAIGLAMSATASVAQGMDELTVAYFLEWPMPFQYAKQMGIYEEELGITINWRAFDTGTAMSAAMASGDVDISISQGVPPFVVAASAGQDIQVVDVAVSYSENDNCVVHADQEIDASNVADLEGARVGVPIGTAAHYGFLRQMEHFGVDVSSLEVVDMAPADSAAALAQGSLLQCFALAVGAGRIIEDPVKWAVSVMLMSDAEGQGRVRQAVRSWPLSLRRSIAARFWRAERN